MAHYEATVTQDRLLELQSDVRRQLKPGEIIGVDIEDDQPYLIPAPNNEALALLEEIAARQTGRRHTDPSQTDEIIRKGRSGAMYGHEPFD
jgi:hypothetical protein